MHYFDSHAHLTSTVFPEVEGILTRAQEAQVKTIVNICTDPLTLERGLALQKRFPWVYVAGATTPHDVEKEGEKNFSIFAEAARSGGLVAVGETGLDYHYEHSNREVQQEFLKQYLKLALECHLPIVIHCREAFSDLFQILDRHYHQAPGILHCFTGTLKEAWGVVERGWYLSLSGIVTFKKSEELRQVAREIPLQHLLIETDTPYLAPQSKRGRQNEPSFLPETAACIATVRGVSVEEVARATFVNACSVFDKIKEMA